MNDTLVICGLIPNDPDIDRKTKNFMNAAANQFTSMILMGLRENEHTPFVLSAPFIGSFPLNYSALSFDGRYYGSNSEQYISFNNIWGIRNISRNIALRRALNKNDLLSIKNVLIYSVHTPFVLLAKYIKRKNPAAKICLIVCDLPEYMNLRSNQSWLYRSCKKFDCKLFYNNLKEIDCFAVVTKYMSSKVNTYRKPETVIDYMINSVAEKYHPTENSPKRILYSGSLNMSFGIDRMLKAFSLIEGDVELHLCGSGDANEYITKQSIIDQRIIYYGVVSHDEVTRMQRNADILINPRICNEEFTKFSFPIKTIEYLATGRPTIAYKLYGVGDEYDGHIIVPKDDSPETLANCMKQTLNLGNKQLESIFNSNTCFIKREKSTKVQVMKIMNMFR